MRHDIDIDAEGPLVYLLQVETDEGTKYKIGYTSRSIRKRLRGLKTGCPFDIVPLKQFQSPRARAVETVLHRRYRYLRGNGEWFDLTDEQRDAFHEDCAVIDQGLNMLETENTWYQAKKDKKY